MAAQVYTRPSHRANEDAAALNRAHRLFRLGHFKGMDDEAAALALGNWARRNEINVMFEVRRVREQDVLYLLMRDKRQC
jgi:hypothetical protein